MGYEQTSSDFKCLQGFVLALWVFEGFWRDNAPLMAEVVKLITAWKEESVGQRKWNIPKHCVWSCCSSLYVIISAELSKREERGTQGGYIQGSREQKRSCRMMEWVLERVRQKGKVNLCCHGNWHGCEEQTGINLFTLKEQQGRGGHLKRNYITLVNLGVLSVRGLIAAVIWPCDPAVIPPHHLFSHPSSANQVPSFH